MNDFFLIALTPISTSTYLSSLWELLERHVTEGSTIPLSLHQDISHSFDVLLSIVRCVTFYCIISTSDGVILISSCSKADSQISGTCDSETCCQNSQFTLGFELFSSSSFLSLLDSSGTISQRLEPLFYLYDDFMFSALLCCKTPEKPNSNFTSITVQNETGRHFFVIIPNRTTTAKAINWK